MPSALKIRDDYSAVELRKLAKRSDDNNQARRLLSLAAVIDGMDRTDAARIGGMDRQTLRDLYARGSDHGKDFEAGMYLPTVRDADGSFSASGVKLRLKWLPLKPAEDNPGWYAGVNWEVARIDKRYSDSPMTTEVRTIIGYRADQWLLGVNPILSWDLSPGYRNGGPDMVLGFKGVHDVAEGIALGLEYYSGIGKLSHPLPHSLQEHTIYAVMDFDRKPFDFNLGIGRGLTGATDQWTVKAIFNVPF